MLYGCNEKVDLAQQVYQIPCLPGVIGHYGSGKPTLKWGFGLPTGCYCGRKGGIAHTFLSILFINSTVFGSVNRQKCLPATGICL
jgi:hypothetical protein